MIEFGTVQVSRDGFFWLEALGGPVESRKTIVWSGADVLSQASLQCWV